MGEAQYRQHSNSVAWSRFIVILRSEAARLERLYESVKNVSAKACVVAASLAYVHGVLGNGAKSRVYGCIAICHKTLADLS